MLPWILLPVVFAVLAVAAAIYQHWFARAETQAGPCDHAIALADHESRLLALRGELRWLIAAVVALALGFAGYALRGG